MSHEKALKEIKHKVRELMELCSAHPDLGESNQILYALRLVMGEEVHYETSLPSPEEIRLQDLAVTYKVAIALQMGGPDIEYLSQILRNTEDKIIQLQKERGLFSKSWYNNLPIRHA